MHINGATPGSNAYALGLSLLGTGQATGGALGAEEITAGNAIIHGFDDKDAGALEALGGAIGLAIGGVGGAAIGAGFAYVMSGLVGGETSDGSSSGGTHQKN